MHDSQRVLGKLEEFQEWSKREFGDIQKEFAWIKEEVQKLNLFKWQIYSAAAVISGIMTFMAEMIRIWMKVKIG